MPSVHFNTIFNTFYTTDMFEEEQLIIVLWILQFPQLFIQLLNLNEKRNSDEKIK